MITYGFDVLAAAMGEIKAQQAGRLKHFERLATRAAEMGEIPAFSLDGLRVQVVQLHQVERLLTTLVPIEDEIRRLDPRLGAPLRG